jgi:hypothetical protein
VPVDRFRRVFRRDELHYRLGRRKIKDRGLLTAGLGSVATVLLEPPGIGLGAQQLAQGPAPRCYLCVGTLRNLRNSNKHVGQMFSTLCPGLPVCPEMKSCFPKTCRMLSTAIHLKAGSQARQRSPAARESKARHVHAMAWRGSGRNRNY